MSALEYLPPLEVKRVGDAGELEGLASTFNNVDLTGDIVAPGAFRATIREHRAAKTMPALLWSHDASAPVGVWTEMREDSVGLRMKGRLSLETVRGAEARALAMDGALGLSIGFRTRDAGYEKGRRVLKDLQLFEVSLVSIPANPAARLTSVKSAVAPGDGAATRALVRIVKARAGVVNSLITPKDRSHGRYGRYR